MPSQPNKLPILQFITKEGGCSLCEEAFEEVESAKDYVDFEVEIVKLREGDSDWERYKNDFPVILIDGKFAFRHRTTRDLLIRKLQPKPKWKFWSRNQ
ncbi:MAG: glutaredoxin family protein [Bacteroidota bacterium]|nr:glutaredoxin family protein [Bacteroidota bacterium]MDP4231893.1 glutaredoxin family protein [Bacteroidota bacterium]MDP4241400.1 glutaredoxin family protein [Bacteroidota bacterium]MDP4287323.1 glutaredoxin family protein [Bacteroidota bacterium]